MFLGSRVDDAVSLYYRRRLAGEQLDLEQVKDAYRELWKQRLEQRREARRRLGGHPLSRPRSRRDWTALELTFEQLVPKLGEPVAVQRQLEFTLRPRWNGRSSATWTSRREAARSPERRSSGSSTTRSRTRRSTSRRPTATPRRACTSRADGCRATRPRSSALPRSPSRVPRRRQMSTALVPTNAHDRADARHARPDRARRQRDRRDLRAPGPRPALGVRGPHELEVLGEFCAALRTCPGGAGL